MLQASASQVPIDQFVSDLRQICGQFDVRHDAPDPTMFGGISVESRAGVEIAMVHTSIQQVLRSTRNIRQDDAENCFLILQKEGKALMSQDNKSVLLNPGEMVLIDSARPSEFTFFGEYSYQISLHLPRTELYQRFGSDLVSAGLSLPRNNPTNMAIQGVLGTIFGQTGMSAQTQTCLREALMELIGALLYDQSGRDDYQGVETDPGSASVWSQSTAYIDAKYHDPDFTLQNMASELGLSLRQVQRAFATAMNGVTPSKYVLTKRLEHTRRELDAIRVGTRRGHISTIAYEAGFSDLSYFHRCFRKAFGKTPKAFLAGQ